MGEYLRPASKYALMLLGLLDNSYVNDEEMLFVFVKLMLPIINMLGSIIFT